MDRNRTKTTTPFPLLSPQGGLDLGGRCGVGNPLKLQSGAPVDVGYTDATSLLRRETNNVWKFAPGSLDIAIFPLFVTSDQEQPL